MPIASKWPSLEEEVQNSNNGDLTLREIRIAATQFGFEEWYYCEAYDDLIQVAAFRKTCDNSGDVTKVQVFPKTHAVSVLYIHNDGEQQSNQDEDNEDDHPTVGGEMLSNNKKSLYVVQDVNYTDTVKEMFKQPLEFGKDLIYTRRDTLAGKWSPPVDPADKLYCGNCHRPPRPNENLLVCTRCKSVAYCDRNCQRRDWKKGHKKECGDVGEFDISRRWHHVAVTSGLTTDRDELEEIMKICHLFELLLFEPGGPACLCRARHGCGSVCALSSLLLEIGRQHHDVIGFASQEYAFMRLRGQVEKEERYRASFHPCMNHDAFMDDFGDFMKQLEEMIVELKPNVRSEVLQWFFERIRCNEKIVMIDSDEMPLMKKQVTFPIHFANMDYSRLVYGEDAEEHICFMHGTFHRESFENDGSDDGTEGTAEESDSEDENEEQEQEQEEDSS